MRIEDGARFAVKEWLATSLKCGELKLFTKVKFNKANASGAISSLRFCRQGTAFVILVSQVAEKVMSGEMVVKKLW
jgi:hypothetical protein